MGFVIGLQKPKGHLAQPITRHWKVVLHVLKLEPKMPSEFQILTQNMQILPIVQSSTFVLMEKHRVAIAQRMFPNVKITTHFWKKKMAARNLNEVVNNRLDTIDSYTIPLLGILDS